MKQIERKDYMNTLIGLRDKNLIKVLTGVRRCGKSTVMQMFRDYLIADNVGENQLVFMNFESLENRQWLTWCGAQTVGWNLECAAYVCDAALGSQN